jgi:hypothetical protein
MTKKFVCPGEDQCDNHVAECGVAPCECIPRDSECPKEVGIRSPEQHTSNSGQYEFNREMTIRVKVMSRTEISDECMGRAMVIAESHLNGTIIGGPEFGHPRFHFERWDE